MSTEPDANERKESVTNAKNTKSSLQARISEGHQNLWQPNEKWSYSFFIK